MRLDVIGFRRTRQFLFAYRQGVLAVPQTVTRTTDPLSRVAASFAVRIDHGEHRLFYATCLHLQACKRFGATREQALARIKGVILDHLQVRFATHAVAPSTPLPAGSELVEINA